MATAIERDLELGDGYSLRDALVSEGPTLLSLVFELVEEVTATRFGWSFPSKMTVARAREWEAWE